MSAGTPFVSLRIPQVLIDRIEETIARNNRYNQGEPWTRASWILDAIRDKIAHQERARVQRLKRRLPKRRPFPE